MTEIIATGVTITKSGREILADANLRACSGEFIAIIGANGAGKSTLLAVLAGLSKPDCGTIVLDGTPLHGFTRGDIARRRAYLPQNPRCEWPISVERLVALGLTPVLPVFGGLGAAEEARIETALSDCGLLSQRHQAATTLSGGELARAMLARALVGNPDVLIVDEPIEDLDPRHALDAVMRLRVLAGNGKLVIAAIHDLTLAARFAGRVIALHKGRIVADGPPKDVLKASLLRLIFDVEATVSVNDGRICIDYIAPG